MAVASWRGRTDGSVLPPHSVDRAREKKDSRHMDAARTGHDRVVRKVKQEGNKKKEQKGGFERLGVLECVWMGVD